MKLNYRSGTKILNVLPITKTNPFLLFLGWVFFEVAL